MSGPRSPLRITPLTVGHSGRRVSCLHYRPSSGNHSPAGPPVLIVSPPAEDFSRSFYVFRDVALRLASAGRHVLRAEPYGVGDSDGTYSDQTFAAWREDVRAAADELAYVTDDSPPPVLVTAHAGVFLLAGCGVEARATVAWDPVRDGREFLDSLRRADALRRAEAVVPIPRPGPRPDGSEELAGHLWGAALLDDVRKFSPDPSGLPGERVTFVYTAGERPAGGGPADPRVSARDVDEYVGWFAPHKLGQLFTGKATADAVADAVLS